MLIGCYFPEEADREAVNSFPQSVQPVRVGKSQQKYSQIKISVSFKITSRCGAAFLSCSAAILEAGLG